VGFSIWILGFIKEVQKMKNWQFVLHVCALSILFLVTAQAAESPDKLISRYERGELEHIAFLKEAKKLGATAVPAIRQALAKSRDRGTKARFIDALGEIGDPQAVPIIAAVIENASEPDRELMEWVSVQALDKIKGLDAARLLLKIRRTTKSEDQTFLSQLLPTAIANIRDKSAAPAFLEELDKKDGFIGEALWKLGELQEKSAVKRITAFLADPDPGLRAVAATVLGQIGDAAATAPLRSALEKEKKTDTRVSMLGALTKLGEAKARAQLEDAAKQGNDARVQCEAIGLLAEMPDKNTLTILKGLLSDLHFDVRLCTIGALQTIGGEEAIQLLESVAANDPEKWLRNQAKEAVQHLRDKRNQ
jgi:HEAT repeat protein